MDESIPTAPSTFLSIVELIEEMQCRGQTPSMEQNWSYQHQQRSWSYRCNGFLFDAIDVGNSGFDFLLASSKRLSPCPPTVKVNTQKVVPWPEDVRDGDLVQIVANLQASKEGEMGLSAISVVRINDMETEHDLNLLVSSHKQIMQFIKRPESSVSTESLTTTTLLTSKTSSSFSTSSSSNTATTELSSTYAAPPPLPLLREPNQQTKASLSQQQQPLSPIDPNSLFDDDDDDHFKLVSQLDKLASTATTSPRTSGRDDSTLVASRNHPTNDSFPPPTQHLPPLPPPPQHFLPPPQHFLPPPQHFLPPQRLPSKPARASAALASKNAGKFSRGGASKHKKLITSDEQQSR